LITHSLFFLPTWDGCPSRAEDFPWDVIGQCTSVLGKNAIKWGFHTGVRGCFCLTNRHWESGPVGPIN
jgi:hypothetical protein